MEKLKVLIGRSSQCDYTIENIEQHGTVSGKHATISETDIPNTYLFEDHSTNGSYINGQLVHNDSCKVYITDHITLGRTYTLPLTDIVKRYFTERRITKKKPQEVQPQALPQDSGRFGINEETRPMPSSDESVSTPSDATKQVPAVITETITVEKVPDWYWVLYAVSILIAFAVGFFLYDAIN